MRHSWEWKSQRPSPGGAWRRRKAASFRWFCAATSSRRRRSRTTRCRRATGSETEASSSHERIHAWRRCDSKSSPSDSASCTYTRTSSSEKMPRSTTLRTTGSSRSRVHPGSAAEGSARSAVTSCATRLSIAALRNELICDSRIRNNVETVPME
ncbi:hypothetical protein MXAN_5458 [Myxococcus xanthus DK 1622]|uniref:Uncharacterized protein n=1 Tax=Myxococcus xanthus (strain DK1622) TaxID=246197 RepID=Q1D172_MYXXD|nr:hypothetical protein MXAN_5458 [Myxococcus xanthus DK 1622]